MNTKNGYFNIDFKKSLQRLSFDGIPQKYANHALHYVVESKKDNYYSTENLKYGYWYMLGDNVPLSFDCIKLYAFDLDNGVELIDEYKFNIADFNFMFNLKTNNIDEANTWIKYIDLFNKIKNVKVKYGVNIATINESYDNFEISREKYNKIYSFSESESIEISSFDIIKKIVGSI